MKYVIANQITELLLSTKAPYKAFLTGMCNMDCVVTDTNMAICQLNNDAPQLLTEQGIVVATFQTCIMVFFSPFTQIMEQNLHICQDRLH
jgi:hypothetical protein